MVVVIFVAMLRFIMVLITVFFLAMLLVSMSLVFISVNGNPVDRLFATVRAPDIAPVSGLR